jgi:ribosome-binding protein aMBF1 (putative translation factor)
LKDIKDDEFSTKTMAAVLKEWREWQKDMWDRRRKKKREVAVRYGRAVKVQRARRMMGQKQMADRMGINVTVLAKIETGVIVPSERLHIAMVELFRSLPEAVMDKNFRTMKENLLKS